MLPVTTMDRAAVGRQTWRDAVDAVVLALHRHGFLQSLIVHVTLLLVMALTVIEPRRPRVAVRLALDFAAAAEAPVDAEAVSLAEPEMREPAEPDLLAVVPGLAIESWQPATEPQPALELAGPEMGESPVGLDSGDLLAEVSVPVRLAGFAAGPAGFGPRTAGGGRGDGPGFGGELGRRLAMAGARTGDVQVSIAWDNFNDIDVHVMVESVAPWRGVSMINFSNRRGGCGGWLDVDQNVVPTTPKAVENVFWARGTAPYGRYTVYVHQFRNWGGADPTEVHVAVLVDGKQAHHKAVVRNGSSPVVVTSFVRTPVDASAPEPSRDDFDDGSLAPAP